MNTAKIVYNIKSSQYFGLYVVVSDKPSQTAVQKSNQQKDKPVNNSTAVDCCCLVAPWQIKEQDRSYALKVTKLGKQRIGTLEVDAPVKEPYSNALNKRHELHIVTPDMKDDKITYKTVTVEHSFLKKTCDLKMIAKVNNNAKQLAGNGQFEIGSDRSIKGMVKTDTQAEEITFVSFIKSIFNPNDTPDCIQIYPAGSSKCMGKAYVYVHDKATYNGGISFEYGSQHTTNSSIGGRNQKIDVTRSALLFEGKINYKKGDTHYEFSAGGASGIDKNGNRQVSTTKRKSQHLKRIGAENIFSDYQDKINNFHRFFEKINKLSISPIKFEPGLTKASFKIEGAHDANPDDYNLIRNIKLVEIELAFFDGSAIILDILTLACRAGGAIGGLLIKARKHFEDKGQILRLECSIGGSIKGTLKYTKDDFKKPWKAEGSIAGAINLEVVGEVRVEGSILWVSVAAGAYVKSGSKESIDNKVEVSANLTAKTKEDDIIISGGFGFNGLTVYFASFLEISARGNKSNKDKKINTSNGRQKKKAREIRIKRDFKAEGHFDVIDPWKGKQELGTLDNFLT
jgi:hypothetical protein